MGVRNFNFTFKSQIKYFEIFMFFNMLKFKGRHLAHVKTPLALIFSVYIVKWIL